MSATSTVRSAGSAVSMSVDLWNSRPRVSPADQLRSLADECERLNVQACDVYGDFDATPQQSYLRRFESEIASTFGKEDALFLPSGVMAQQIALLIHYHAPQNTSSPVGRSFVCHYSSHILLHEKDTCSHLLNMKSLVIEAVPKTRDQPPVSFNDVQAKLDWAAQKPCAVVLECPHREIGGKCTSYADLERISELCRSRCVAFHMDGARLWEAVAHYTTGTTAAGKAVTAQDLCSLFDSIYVSCYKGIGGMTGAVLLGSATFIAEARVWLRRFGGNVFTLLPYAVSSYASYRNYVAWNSNSRDLGTAAAGAVTGASAEDSALSTSEPPYSMQARRQRMQHIVALLSAQPSLQEYVRFDPPVPQVCLVHVYILTDAATAMRALEVSRAQTGIACFARVRPAPEIAGVDASSFVDECYFEFNMGLANGAIPDEVWVAGWTAFVEALDSLTQAPLAS